MNTRRKEYEEIYDYSNYGFLFYYNKRISKSIPISKEDMRKISIGKGNGDKIFVVCKPCDIFMDFKSGPGDLEGQTHCPCCGARMRECTAYTQLDRENEEFMNNIESDNDFDEFYDW